MNSTTSIRLIERLQHFSLFVIPEQMVFDNGLPFTSYEFENFVRSSGIIHNGSAHYDLATNGKDEKLVQTFRRAMKIGEDTPGGVFGKVENFLLL